MAVEPWPPRPLPLSAGVHDNLSHIYMCGLLALLDSDREDTHLQILASRRVWRI